MNEVIGTEKGIVRVVEKLYKEAIFGPILELFIF